MVSQVMRNVETAITSYKKVTSLWVRVPPWPQKVLLYGVYSVSGLARWVVVPLAPVRIWLDTLLRSDVRVARR